MGRWPSVRIGYCGTVPGWLTWSLEVGWYRPHSGRTHFCGLCATRSLDLVACCVRFARVTKASKRRGLRPRRPPPPMVWGGNTSIPCRGFGGGFGFLSILTKLSFLDQNLCMGWGFWPGLAILSILAKTRCVFDLQLLNCVRHAASFGYFGKIWAKTRCVSD